MRSQNRLRGLTQPGKDILEAAQRMVDDADRIAKIAQDFSDAERGRLTIATTHTQARYALPPLIRRFAGRYPAVEVMIRQASPAEILGAGRQGEADVCIGSESAEGARPRALPVL